MRRVLVLALFLGLFMLPAVAQAQETPKVAIDNSACGRFKAMVTDLPVDAKVRFQLGHDLVKKVQVTEQDTAAAFDSGPFPASDWGFSVRVNDRVILDQIVTVKPCPSGELPFTGPSTTAWLTLLVLGLGLVAVGLLLLRTRRT